MDFIAKKAFSSARWGNVKVGQKIDVEGGIARAMIEAGVIELSPQAAQQLREAEMLKKAQAAKAAKAK